MGLFKSWKYFSKGIRPAQILAFSTSSTAATLPVTMDCVRDNLGVDEEVSSFVLPVGATVNMDGTALYQSIAVIFMAQFHMIDLTLAQQATIIFTATLASIGAASVPSAVIDSPTSPRTGRRQTTEFFRIACTVPSSQDKTKASSMKHALSMPSTDGACSTFAPP